MKKYLLIFILALVLFSNAYADVPRVISYQGVLTDASGKPINGGSPRTIEITIVNSLGVQHPSGFKFTDTYILQGGLFFAALGEQPKSNMPFPDLDGEWFLQINDKTSSTTYKVPLFSAQSAISIADNSVTSSKIKDGEVTRSKLAAGDANGQILVWNNNTKLWELKIQSSSATIQGTSPIEANSTTGAIKLSDGEQTGQLLVWNNTTRKWEIKAPINLNSTLPILYNNSTGNISIKSGNSPGQILVWDGDSWELQSQAVAAPINGTEPIQANSTNGNIKLADGANDGDALVWKNGKWQSLEIPTIPVGTIVAYYGETLTQDLINQGWAICDGSNILNGTDYDEIRGLANAAGHPGTFPNLQGYFLRGATPNGNSTDPDRAGRTGGSANRKIGSTQPDEFESHNHPIRIQEGLSGRSCVMGQANSPEPVIPADTAMLNTGGSETRPKNVYVNYIIKAK